MQGKGLAIALLAAGLITTPVKADPDTAPAPAVITCSNLVADISGLPSDSPVTLTYAASDLTARCTATNGAALVLSSPTTPVVINLSPDSTQTIPFTVSDAQGDTASASIIVTRD